MSQPVTLASVGADPAAQPRAAISNDKVAEYAEQMMLGDSFPPLVVFFDGKTNWLADGFHRYHAAIGAGYDEFPCDVRRGGLREAILYSCGANAAHGIPRTNEDKRRAVMKLLSDEEWSHWSDGEIAKHALVSDRYVAKLRDEIALTPNVRSKERTYRTKHGTVSKMKTGRIGNSRTKQPAQPLSLGLEQHHGHRPSELPDPGRCDQAVGGTLGADENEWNTREDVLDIVRSVLGTIDLDPASSKQAQQIVKAARYFTKETDGLGEEWKGRVWLNPPHAEPFITEFVDKLVAQWKCGNVTAAIVLMPNHSHTDWFQKLALYAKAICFPRGRLRLVPPDESLAAPTFGNDIPNFADAFKEIGVLVLRSDSSGGSCPNGLALNDIREAPLIPGADSADSGILKRTGDEPAAASEDLPEVAKVARSIPNPLRKTFVLHQLRSLGKICNSDDPVDTARGILVDEADVVRADAARIQQWLNVLVVECHRTTG